MSATHIALISPYDAGNLGDAAILDSVSKALRAIAPGCRLTAVTLAPQAMPAYHGVPGWPITGASIEFYAINPSVPVPAGLAPAEVAAPTDPAPAEVAETGRRLGIGRIPVLGPLLRGLRTVLRFAVADLKHWRASYKWLGDVNLVLVAGGGQFDDEWGGAWGHPYALFKWSVLARLRAVPFVVASVGVCRTENRTARYFFSRALRNARWISFRDEQSIERAAAIEPARLGKHVPDLAFALQAGSAESRRVAGERLRIGVSPIAYRMPGAWPIPDAVRFEEYKAVLLELITSLRSAGHEVVLFTSERTDRDVVQQVQEHFAARGEPPLESSLPDRLSDLLETLTGFDAIVTSRLHGIIISHVLGIPAAALSYDRKVRTHMRDMGHEHYCLDIDAPELVNAPSMVNALIAARVEVAKEVRTAIAPRRALVVEQYGEIMRMAQASSDT